MTHSTISRCEDQVRVGPEDRGNRAWYGCVITKLRVPTEEGGTFRNWLIYDTLKLLSSTVKVARRESVPFFRSLIHYFAIHSDTSCEEGQEGGKRVLVCISVKDNFIFWQQRSRVQRTSRDWELRNCSKYLIQPMFDILAS